MNEEFLTWAREMLKKDRKFIEESAISASEPLRSITRLILQSEISK